MRSFKSFLFVISLTLAAITLNAQEVIQLYDGPAPGSETWDWEEGEFGGIITGVTRPTLTVYRPEHPNGVAMIVCPGGAFCILSFDKEGIEYAKTLNTQGITCFILKYRLYHSDDLASVMSNLNAEQLNAITKEVVPMTLADAAIAIRYVRSHAAEYGIDPTKIGITGSSAGGSVTMGTSMKYTDEESCPNFAVACYPYLTPHIPQGEVPTNHALPLFIVAATDDSMVPIAHSLTFYEWWRTHGQKVEMHIYQQGEHGFVGSLRGMAVDDWTDDLFRWFKDVYPDNF